MSCLALHLAAASRVPADPGVGVLDSQLPPARLYSGGKREPLIWNTASHLFVRLFFK